MSDELARGDAAGPSTEGPARVLVVDDESNITDLVSTALRYEGFEVATAGDGREALTTVESFRPDLVVLDVMLPDVDGFEVQRRLVDRGRPVPVVFLTARDATEDKVRGLTIGGDDYVTKPFSLEELVARIRSVLRRARAASPEGERLRFADLEMDEDAHEVRRGEHTIELTATEFSLLRFLLMNPRRVLSKAQILDHVWHYDFGGDPAIVETYISYLRKKVDAVEPHLIHTVRGVGYVLRLPPGVIGMSLRARLLLVTVGLVAAGLLVANVATFHFTRTFLERRVDEQLAAARPFAAAALTDQGPFDEPPPGVAVPPGTYAEFRDRTGTVVAATTFGYEEEPAPPLPAELPEATDDGSGHEPTASFTVRDGRTAWRALATTLQSGGVLIVAVPLAETHETLRQLLGVGLVASVLVLAAAAGLALWLVRLGLRPLEDMGRTADAIAAGDLTRRVSPAEPRTEVGRLGIALNGMLVQIEAAFEQRRASERRLRRFVADASHELRTPLTSIRGYAELFRRGADQRPEDLARSMAAIEAEAARMGVLVDDLLLLARIDQGRPLEREPVDVGAVAAEAADAARAIDPGREVTIEIEGEPTIEGDGGRLRQVFDNLLDNARVHTPPGTAAHVAVRRTGDEVLASVADDGPGLSDEARGKVFERFYRDDAARSRETGGAGLGLAIVAAIVRAHGGEVSVGEAGGGAAFELRLPVRAPIPPPPPPPSAGEAGDAP